MTEKHKMVGTEPKKSVLKNRLKTLAKVGIAAAAVTLGSKVQAAQGSPMRRGYSTPQVETITQPAVQYVSASTTVGRTWQVSDSRRPMFGQGSRGGMITTMGGHSSRHGRMPRMGGHGLRHDVVPRVTGHADRQVGVHVAGRGHGFVGPRGGGRTFGPRGAGRGFGPRGGRPMRPRGRGRGF